MAKSTNKEKYRIFASQEKKGTLAGYYQLTNKTDNTCGITHYKKTITE